MTNFDKLWNFHELEETRKKFEDYLQENKDSSFDEILQVKTQIARTYSLNLEFDRSHALLDEVEKNLSDETPIAKIRYLLERGRTYNSAGEKSKAFGLFEQAVDKAADRSDVLYIDAVHMAAIAAPNLEIKRKWSDLGTKKANESTDPSCQRWEGIFLNNTGWDFFEAERYKEALELFEACEAFHTRNGNEGPRQIARWSVAKALRYLDQGERALKLQLELLEINNGEDEGGYVYEELGELYLDSDAGKSKKYMGLAYSVLSQDTWLKKNEPERLARLKDLG